LLVVIFSLSKTRPLFLDGLMNPTALAISSRDLLNC
jgi:hypothetical protein